MAYRKLLPVALGVLALSWAVPSAAQTTLDLDEFFAEFAKKREGIQMLRAPFTQLSVTTDDKVTSTGHIIYARPKRIVLRYDGFEDAGDAMVYLTDGKVYYEYDEESRQLQSWKIEDRPGTEALFFGFSDDSARLRDAYDMFLRPPEDGGGGVELELRPLDADSGESGFEKIVLQLRKKDLLPTKIYLVNDAESNMTIQVGVFSINRGDGSDATLLVPEGTEILHDDEYVETTGPEGVRVPRPNPGANDNGSAP
ncbi:MAG TPA: outer membrane lipoprotein carrier protein LolA [Gammaproteobacteria bacterium]|nr:outer membrane lipoprotein carrier protein LolA [Gammaproteobacteria bacterium]